MKIKIIKKTIKEGISKKTGNEYSIKSLYCSVSTKEDANAIAVLASAQGATMEQIQSAIKMNDYQGEISYAFGLNCSNYTFENVQRFGVLDCEMEAVLKDGFLNFKIKAVDRKEVVNGYTAPDIIEDDVQGWSNCTPPPKPQGDTPTIADLMESASPAQAKNIDVFGNINQLAPDNTDLPF
jgi:hypothetical protein